MNDIPNLITRRNFLAQSGVAAAALSFPHIARAQDAAGPTLRVGIIGSGGRSHNVGDMAIQDGRFKIVALADYFQDAVDRQGAKFNVPADRRYTGLDCFRKLIDAGNVDIVAVLSPPYFHPEQVEAAVEAGLHVWLAKPIAVDAPGVARIEAAAAEATRRKRCVLVDFQTRAFAHYHEAARRVAAGDLGTLGYGEVEGTCGAFVLRTPHGSQEAKLKNWLQWRELCGESILEFSIHAIDLANLMIGRKPVSATGFCGRNLLDHMPAPTPGDVRDHWIGTYDYGDGLKVGLRCKRLEGHGVANHGGIYVNLHGSHGSLHSNYGGQALILGKKSFNGDKFMGEKIRGIYNSGISHNWNTFYDNITQENFAQETVAPSVQSHYMALLARKACYGKGETVTWDEVVSDTTSIEFDTTGLKS